MVASMFYVDDTCVLKEDPNIIAIVERTSHDIDGEPFLEEPDWFTNPAVTPEVMETLKRTGVPTQGHIVIKFVDPHSGTCLAREDQLELVDRTFTIGDLVKHRSMDAMSGLVTRTSLECTLMPVHPGLELKEGGQWPLRGDRLLRKIPAEELRYLENYFEGNYVIYHGWIGVITSVYVDVTIRLANKSVVMVEDSDELCIPIANQVQRHNVRADATKGFAGLVHAVSVAHEQGKDSIPPKLFYPGQRVVTKKMNLRRGIWKFGAYNANIPPRGTIVDVQGNGIQVNWLACNVYDKDRSNPEAPPEYLDPDALAGGEVRVYDVERTSSETNHAVGTMKGSKLVSGEYVRFEDIAGAAVKYSGNSEHGTLQKIPRTETQGYDMNVYLIRETNLKLIIRWQDGSESEEEAKNVIPYLNSDEHEVRPGTVVLEREDGMVHSSNTPSTDNSDIIKPSRIGVVQSSDAQERTAVVRWFAAPNVQILNFPDAVLLPGSILGTLSQESHEVSCFEIASSSALAKFGGDLVLILPEDSQNAQAIETSNPPSGSMYQYFSSTVNALRVRFVSGVASTNGGAAISALVREPCNWIGTIVDLGLDGTVTVRLGGLETICDVQVPRERVSTLVTAGEEDLLFEEMEDEKMEDITDDEWSQYGGSEESERKVLHESVEYEGGQRVDVDGGEDVWMTDDDEDRLAPPPTDIETEDAPTLAEEMLPVLENNEIASGRPQFSQYPNVPLPFAILDEPPPQAHHYIDDRIILNANLMRRIRKEHKILQGSLPEGIWVRTWADRLDLIRVLIIGADGTPYNLAPFVIDFQFPQEFPRMPPNAHFHSWTNGLGRINPNLYEDGKICLSLLGTWSGKQKHESWSENGSSMLQVIVSLLGLVLVKEPYYNEAGYEALAESQDFKLSANQYSELVDVMSKGFIVHALYNEVTGLSDVIAWLYKFSAGQGPELLAIILDDATQVLQGSERRRKEDVKTQRAKDGDAMEVDEQAKAKSCRLSLGAMILLKKYVKAMEDIWEKCGFEARNAEQERGVGKHSETVM